MQCSKFQNSNCCLLLENEKSILKREGGGGGVAVADRNITTYNFKKNKKNIFTQLYILVIGKGDNLFDLYIKIQKNVF